MKILVDTREQLPFSFDGVKNHGEVEVEQAALPIGDYSLPGLTDKVAVERKELADLIACLGRERERFERELARSLALDAFCVVVEADWKDLAQGKYRSKFNPHSAGQSLAAFMARYRALFFLAGSRRGAEYMTWSFLRQYLEGAKKRWAAIAKSQGG